MPPLFFICDLRFHCRQYHVENEKPDVIDLEKLKDTAFTKGYHFDNYHAMTDYFFWLKKVCLVHDAPVKLSVFQYWKLMDQCRGRALPHLIRLAKCVLLIPPVTVECERMFSWKRWVQDDRSKSRDISVLSALCHIFMDHRKGRNDISDDDAFAVLQKLGVAPRLRTADRGKTHKRVQKEGDRKNAKNRRPLWDKERMQEVPEEEPAAGGVGGVGGVGGGGDGGGAGGEDESLSPSSESDVPGGDSFGGEAPGDDDDDDVKLEREMEAAQLRYAMELIEREGLGMLKLDPLVVCGVCNLPYDKHPRAVSSTQCSLCKHWTHDAFCFAPGDDTCRKCFVH